MRKIFIFIIMMIPLINFADILTTSEQELIYKVLTKIDLDSTSINFLKDWASDTRFKIPLITEIINNPMKFPVFVSELDTKIGDRKTGELIEYFGEIIYSWEIMEGDHKEEFEKFYSKSVKSPEDIFDYVEYVWQKAEKNYRKTWKEISEEEKKRLEYFALTVHQEAEDSLKYKTYFAENSIVEYKEMEIEELIEIIEKIDFGSMIDCASIMQAGFDVLQSNFQEMDFDLSNKIERATKYGNFCIGTNEIDIYQKKYSFILDPSGDDLYNSEIKTNFQTPFYWILDLSGDDKYQNPNIRSMFSVLSGCGISSDNFGDDFYASDDFAFSSFFGIQTANDNSGDDIYKNGLHSLAASSFGISILSDETGNDIYSITEFGEGFAGTLAAGLLLDFNGNDLYFAGGKYLHAPLAPLDYRSLSQGFGFGLRPDLAGGFGVLFDENGNDRYNGGVYAQAVAYWYALGILLDKNGNDFYTAVYYPQGSGIHLAGGFLYDEKGEDHYYSKHGPGQGAGHDYAVGFLVDRAGDDSYSVEGGNGLGLTNSVGIFLDVSGNDRYERNNDQSYGYANKARDSGGIGIFLDTGGDDSYPKDIFQNDSLWTRGIYGVGFDTLMVIPEEPVKELAEKQAVDIDSLAEIKKIFSIASEWAVGSSKERVKKAREILLNREIEAAAYISKNEMATKSGLVFRAIQEFAEESTEFQKYYPELFDHSDSLVVKNMIAITGEIADSSNIEILSGFAEKQKYLPTVLSALGKMKSDKSTPILQKYIDSPSEKLRVITARGLKKIDSEKSRNLLLQMKDDSSFLIETMIKLMEEKD